jgi:outer membrane protein assembly factor BamA
MLRSSALASLLLGPALLLACVLPASAQVAQKFVFNDTAPYTADELLATAGLKVGQKLTTNSLGDAAQKLMNTGLFDDAEVTYKGPQSGFVVTFTLKLKPQASLIPISFENLVWFTPQELADGIHAQVPLYHGYASDAGTLPDDIQAAIEQMLKAKNVQATLSHVLLAPGGPVTHSIINFSIEQPKIYLAQLDIRGLDALPPDTAKATQSLIQSMTGQLYNESPE